MKQTRRVEKDINGRTVEFEVEQELTFTGITLEAVGEPVVRVSVGGKLVDPVETFGDEIVRKVICEARL